MVKPTLLTPSSQPHRSPARLPFLARIRGGALSQSRCILVAGQTRSVRDALPSADGAARTPFRFASI